MNVEHLSKLCCRLLGLGESDEVLILLGVDLPSLVDPKALDLHSLKHFLLAA